jgi:hypothetical protein
MSSGVTRQTWCRFQSSSGPREPDVELSLHARRLRRWFQSSSGPREPDVTDFGSNQTTIYLFQSSSGPREPDVTPILLDFALF